MSSLEVMGSYERARYQGLSQILTYAWIDDRISQEDYGIIIRAVNQRREDLSFQVSSRFPSTAHSAEAQRIMVILGFLEDLANVPIGFYNTEVALSRKK